MWKLPLPVPVISIAPASVSASDVNVKGSSLYVVESAGNTTVFRSFAPWPHASDSFTFTPGVARNQMWPLYFFPFTNEKPDWRIPCGVEASSSMRGLCSPTKG